MPQLDRATAIRAAADAARKLTPGLPADFADRAIASGRSLDAVKVELFDLIHSDGRAKSRADMARQVAAMTGEAAPASAGASASRDSMVALLKRQGLEPAH